MKKLLLAVSYLFITVFLTAQTLDISEEIYIGSADGYGIIGKYNERVLFFSLDDSKVKLRALDNKMRKIWEKEVEPDRKGSARILEVLGGKQDFNVIYQFRNKGHNYIKIHKYDAQVKLLDSATIQDWGRDMVSPNLTAIYSEDKKVVMVYELENNNTIKALALSLDSLRPIWFQSFEIKNFHSDNSYTTAMVNNNGMAVFIKEEDNRMGALERHRFTIKHVDAGSIKAYELPLKEMYSIDVKFKFDNVNQRLSAAGIYSNKGFFKGQGYFMMSIPPQYQDTKIYFQPFDDEFISAIQGKKVVDNKGLGDIRVQEIVHRRDGGFLAIIEQVREVERITPSSTTSRMLFRGDQARLSVDYYYDNAFAISLSPEGVTHWKSIFYKKQSSQDDDARYCSYFLVKTPSALRLLFNDEVERATTVSEYLLNGAGQTERHTIMNTEGQDINLRFRDAMQISANEVIVPSDDRRRVKLVKIQY